MNILNCRSNYFRGLRCQRLNPKLYRNFDEIQILNIPIWNLCSFCHFFNSSLNYDTSDKIFDIFTVSTIYFMSYYASDFGEVRPAVTEIFHLFSCNSSSIPDNVGLSVGLSVCRSVCLSQRVSKSLKCFKSDWKDNVSLY